MKDYNHRRHIAPLFRIAGAFVAGAITGIIVWYVQTRTSLPIEKYIDLYVAPLGVIFSRMLHMIVMPLVFFTILSGASSLNLKKFGKVGGKVVLWYLATSVLAAVIGTGLALILNPGSRGLTLEIMKAAIPSTIVSHGLPDKLVFSDIVLNIFENPFKALSEGNFLPVIIFALIFGLALRVVLERSRKINPEKMHYMMEISSIVNEVLFTIVEWIRICAPVGIFALTVVNFSSFGPKLAGPYLTIGLGVIAGMLFMVFVVYPVIIWAATKTSPLRFFRSAQQVMVTAFATRSSAATLPISIQTAIRDLKIKKELAEFSLPLGATINMEGVCIHLPIFAILAANIFGINLGPGAIVMLILTTILAAVGSGGIPGGSLMLLFMLLYTMGLDKSQVSLVIMFAMGINPILDMFETMTNTTGDLMCTYIVADRENLIGVDEDGLVDISPGGRV